MVDCNYSQDHLHKTSMDKYTNLKNKYERRKVQIKHHARGERFLIASISHIITHGNDYRNLNQMVSRRDIDCSYEEHHIKEFSRKQDPKDGQQKQIGKLKLI